MKPVDQIDFSKMKELLTAIVAAGLCTEEEASLEGLKTKEEMATKYVVLIEKLDDAGKTGQLPADAITFYNDVTAPPAPEGSTAPPPPPATKKAKEPKPPKPPKEPKPPKPPKEKKAKEPKPPAAPKSFESIQAAIKIQVQNEKCPFSVIMDNLTLDGGTTAELLAKFIALKGEQKVYNTRRYILEHVKYRETFQFYVFEKRAVGEGETADTYIKLIGYNKPEKAEAPTA